MIKAVLFDLDNTLIDFMKMKRMSIEAAVSSMIDAGLQVKQERMVKELYRVYELHGMEDPLVFQRTLRKLEGKIDPHILAKGIVAYRRVRNGFMDSYPGVRQTLMELKMQGVKIAVVTDAPRIKAWIRLASMEIDHMFDVVVAHEDTRQHKPSVKPFLTALRKLKLDPHETMMVGDWPERDIAGAKKLGILTCFARYGNPEIKKSGADFEAKSARDILTIVTKQRKV